MENNDKLLIRDFKLTTLSLKNKSTVYLLAFMLTVFGVISYVTMPKELFPEINFPTVFVQTVYPGNSPEDIENLITRPLENELQTVKGIKTLKSNSLQDFSMVFVEFNTNVDIKEALLEVKDAIDKAKSKLPTDLMADPTAMNFDFNSLPILNVNLSGDYSISQLKQYADYLKDEIERVNEVSKVDISGVDERKILVEVDLPKMEALGISFTAIENIMRMENMSMSGGEIKIGKTRRTVRTVGEFKTIDDIRNIVIRQDPANTVYLKDVANVTDGFGDKKSFARLNGHPVVTLNVVKKAGENLISATQSTFTLIDAAKKDGSVPPELRVDYTMDQSEGIKRQLGELENSIVMGIILVITVLFLFLGLRNAIIVGLAIPMSLLITFVILTLQGAQINMIVLFSLILALGMLVDDAIVVMEVITRFREKGYSKFEAARLAVGEIAIPVITSTLTTIVAFLPLIFWGGMMGEFMKYMPITLMVVLGASLLVALVFVPVFTVSFESHDHNKPHSSHRIFISALIVAAVAALFYVTGIIWLANLLALLVLLMILHQLFMKQVAFWFSEVLLVKFERFYLRFIRYSLTKNRPAWFLAGTLALLVVTMMVFGARHGETRLFPNGEPAMINVFAELPLGSDITLTDSVARVMEEKTREVLGDNNNLLKSMLTMVGSGVRRDNEMATGETPHRAQVQLNFVDYEFRNGVNTNKIMEDLSKAFIGQYPGIEFYLEKQEGGPPTGNPINIEISGKQFDELLAYADTVMNKIEASGIQGIEGLKPDIELGKPELLVKINRDKAQRYGLSTMAIASTIRTALYGKEISDFKIGEDEYPIEIRLAEAYRYDLSSLMNQKVTSMNMATGQMVQVPISAVADFTYGTTFGSVNRKNVERVVTLYSNALAGYNATSINRDLKALLQDMPLPEGYAIHFTGEQEQTESSSVFMLEAMLLVLALIFVILVTQFNSFGKTLIILTGIFFSIIGVFFGLALFKLDFIIIMTGIGMIALAGIVVKNGIVLVDYITLLKERKRLELGLEPGAALTKDVSQECIIEGGHTRMRPVLMTALTTILGMLPLAVGINIDLIGLFTSFKPNIYFGGDNVLFWGPMSQAIIFGLVFSTFLTLVIVPVMYQVAQQTRIRLTPKKKVAAV
ncbi:MAG: efflux RND transporter permease subunit [Bacteroidales bacterium]|jgi:multidrug efflux pump subunit AcrB